MFDEITKSIKAQLYERTTSPLMGSFLVAWGVWNYKFLILLVTNIPVIEKYRIIDEIVFSTWQQIYLNGLLFPLITSAIYIFAYPYPAKYVYAFTRSRQKELSEIKQEIEDETLLTAAESRSIRREIYTLEEEHQNEINRKNSEIARFKADLDNSQDIQENTESELTNHPDTGDIDLEKGQIEMLKEVGRYDDVAPEKNLIENSIQDIVKSKYDLGELERLEHITRSYNQRLKEYVYELTHKGRSYLVRKKHV